MPITDNKNYSFSFSMIDIKMIDPSPYQHRKYFDENILREDLSVIEAIEANIEIIDVEMGEKPEYLTVGKTPLERVIKLLSKLDSIRRSKARGSVVLEAEKVLSNKYVGQVESIFKNLPKSLKWQSFLIHDLILLTDIPSIVQTASVKHDLSFFKDLFSLMREHSKPSTRIAFLNADFRDFQGIPAFDEDPENAILLLEYAKLLENCGWKITHLIDCPLSTERFTGNMVSKMQEKRTLGIIRRALIIGKPNILHKQGL